MRRRHSELLSGLCHRRFATAILVAGIVMMIAGIVLAAVLYQKGHKK